MSRIFISYSSAERPEALAIQQWLEDNGWDDEVFVDVDPQFGIAGGASWREALRAASGRCEAVLLLLSPRWLASKPCWSEFVLAEKHGKPIIPIKIDHHLPEPADLPEELTNYQIIDKVNITQNEFATRLQYALEKAGAGPENFALPPGRAPYPGLKALTEQDAALFFGRDAEVLSALDTLREIRDTGRKRLFVILGASGSGKSSLLRAGLWPRVNRSDRQFLILPALRPGNAPLSGSQGLWRVLSEALGDPRREQHLDPSVPRTPVALKLAAETNPSSITNTVKALQQAAWTSFADPHARPPSVVLCIDQGEELLSAEQRTEADTFLQLINQLIDTIPEFIVIVAIRSDEYPQLQNDERFPQDQLHPFNLSAMGPAGLARVISGPANRVGLDVDPQLHSLLTSEASGADALPLLAFTLERLYSERLEPDRISMEDYRRLGGTAGAIAAAADDVRNKALASAIAPDQFDALLRRVFLPHLARVNEAGEFARRLARRSDLDAACQPLVDLLIEQRLLVMDQVGDEPTLEIAHEAILREWPLLAGWLNAEKGFLEWREEIARARKAADAAQGDLLTGRALTIAQSFIDTREADIADVDRQFIRASIDADTAQREAEEQKQELVRQAELKAAQAREAAAQTEAEAQKRIAKQARRATRRLSALAVLMTVFALGAAGAGYWAYRSQQEAVAASLVAQTSQKESESRRLASLAAELRDQGGDDKALALAWLALPHDEDMAESPITDEAASAIYQRAFMPISEIDGHLEAIFPEQGPYIASRLKEGRAIVWNSDTLQIVAEFENLWGHEVAYLYETRPLTFSPDGKTLLVMADGRFRVYDIETGTDRMSMPLPSFGDFSGEYSEEIMHYASSPTGERLIAVSPDQRVIVYDVRANRQIADLSLVADTPVPAYADYEENMFGSNRFEGYSGSFFSPDGRLVSTAWWVWKNAYLFVWDVETETIVAVIDGSGSITDVEYSPDNRFLNVDSYSQLVADIGGGPDVEPRYVYLGSTLHDGVDIRTYQFVGPDFAFSAESEGVFHSSEFEDVYSDWSEEGKPYPDDMPPVWAIDTKAIVEDIGLAATEGFLPDIHVSIETGRALTHGNGGSECARYYNFRTSQYLGTLSLDDGSCSLQALSPDARFAFISTCEVDEFGEQQFARCDAKTYVFELSPETASQTRSGGRPVDMVQLSPRRAMLAGHGGNGVGLVDHAGLTVENTRVDPAKFSALAVHKPSGTALLGGWGGQVYRLNPSESVGRRNLIGAHASAISALEISGDGRFAASGSHDGTIRIRSLAAADDERVLSGHSATISGLAHSPVTNSWLSSSFDGTVRLWGADGTTTYIDDAHTAAVYSIRHQATGDLVVSASEDSTLRLWSISAPESVQTLYGHEAAVRDAIWSSDSSRILSISDDRTAKVWHADGRLEYTLSGHIDRLTRGLFSETMDLIVTADRAGQIRIWDTASGALLSVRQTDQSGVVGIALLDSGKSLVAITAAGNTYRWRLADGGLKERIAEVGAYVAGLRPLTARECAQYYLSDLQGAGRVCQTDTTSSLPDEPQGG